MKIVSKGYKYIKKSKHKYSDSDGYISEHRLIMESHIGHLINPKTHEVHHIDGNIKNNSIENLQLLTRSEHRRIHAGWIKKNKKWYKKCRDCKELFEVNSINFYQPKRKDGYITFTRACKKCESKYVMKKRKLRKCLP